MAYFQGRYLSFREGIGFQRAKLFDSTGQIMPTLSRREARLSHPAAVPVLNRLAEKSPMVRPWRRFVGVGGDWEAELRQSKQEKKKMETPKKNYPP